jgi:superfamily II DNA or RNA helicase
MGEVLRNYQREMLGRINEAWRSCRSVMVQMPTGTGKTVLMTEVIRTWTIDHGPLTILIVAHRRELIEQIRQTLDRRTKEQVFDRRTEEQKDIDRRTEGQVFSDKRTEEHSFVTVTSIQKLSRAEENDLLLAKEYSLIIIDEAHHALAKTYRQLWERWPEAKFLGLTATPCRLSGEGFEDLFDVLLQGEDIQWFIDQKWLSDFEYVSARPDSLVMHQIGGLRKRGADGDYQTKEMVTVMDVPESIAHLYDSYEAFAWGKKGIVYAIDRAHASHIAAYYQSKGVRCAVIDSQTPAVERAQIVEKYKASPCSVDVIVNVDIFSEGFDCPEVEFIQLARPTLSLSKYLQQVGRGMRVSEGKDCVLILDNVGLYQTFGLPTESRDWRQMFHGRMAGKGQTGEEMPIFVKPSDLQSEMTKKLVNLEMVRIKRHGERREGLEVFMRHGKYGVMKDGEVTCPAEFEHIKWLQAPYFIMGMYPYAIYNNKVAVVDQNGRDLKPGLYGKVEQEGDIFKGTALDGRTVYWDAKGGRMYDIMPQFERIQRFEVAKAGHDMFLRKCLKGFERPFRQENVYLGDHLTIMGNVLIIENDIKQTYRIRGYQAGFIYVESHDVAGYRFGEISRFGNFVSRRNQLPTDMKPYPDVRRLGLKRLTIDH